VVAEQAAGAPERRAAGAVTRVRSLGAEPEPVPPPVAVLPEPLVAASAQPAAAAEEEGSMEFDLEDLDTPAFMRQGRLLN
jgi:hypothetical protein